MDKNLTDKEVVKALEYWQKFDVEIDEMLRGRFKGDKMLLEQKEIVKITLNFFDLIDRKDEELNRLQARIGIYETCNARKDEAIKHLESEVKRLQAENKRLNILAELGNTRANDYRVMRDRALKAEAENERLKVNLNIELENFATEYDNKIKAEAYKEFAERLKENSIATFSFKGVVMVEDIDNLLQELVGEDK